MTNNALELATQISRRVDAEADRSLLGPLLAHVHSADPISDDQVSDAVRTAVRAAYPDFESMLERAGLLEPFPAGPRDVADRLLHIVRFMDEKDHDHEPGHWKICPVHRHFVVVFFAAFFTEILGQRVEAPELNVEAILSSLTGDRPRERPPIASGVGLESLFDLLEGRGGAAVGGEGGLDPLFVLLSALGRPEQHNSPTSRTRDPDSHTRLERWGVLMLQPSKIRIVQSRLTRLPPAEGHDWIRRVVASREYGELAGPPTDEEFTRLLDQVPLVEPRRPRTHCGEQERA